MLGVLEGPKTRLVLNPEGGAVGEPTAASWPAASHGVRCMPLAE